MPAEPTRSRPVRRGSVAALVFALGAAALLGGCGDPPEKLLDSARGYIARQDLRAASIQLKNALQKDGSLAEGRFLLGQVSLELGDVAEAVKELQRAEELGHPTERVAPLLAAALVRAGQFDKVITKYADTRLADADAQGRLSAELGTAYLAKADLERARSAYQSAASALPANAAARLGMARVSFFADDLEGAERDVAALLQDEPDLAEAHLLQAQILMARKQPEAAVESLAAAVRSRPDVPAYRYELITLLLRLQRADEAKAEVEAMRKAAPNSPATHYLTALIAHRDGRNTEARDEVALALRGAPDFLPAHLLSGSVFFRLGNHTQAQLGLNKVLERIPGHVPARQMLALSLLATAQPTRAMEVVKPLIDADSKDARSNLVIGQTLLGNGEFAAAADYFARASATAPEDAGARMRLGVARLMGGESAQALADLQAAATMDDQGIQADVALVLAHLRARDYDKALAAADAMVDRHPDNAEAHNMRGGVLMARQDLPAAREAFEKALALRPDLLSAVVNLARLDMAADKPDAAAARLDAFVAAHPANVDARIALAELKSSTGAPPAEVLAILEKAAAAAPGALLPKLALVRHHLRQRDARRALTVAQEAAAANASDPAAVEALARAQSAAGQHEQAARSFGRLAALMPRVAAPLVEMGAAQIAAKDLKGAEQSLRRAIALQPGNRVARERLMLLLVEQERLDEALAQARDMQGVAELGGIGFAAEGDIQFRRRNWEPAVTAYRRAIEKSEARNAPVNVRLHGALVGAGRKAEADRLAAGWLRAEERDTAMRAYLAERAIGEQRLKDAERLYREVLDIEPTNALVLNNLAWVAGQLGDPAAISYAEKALEITPDNPAILDTLGMLQVERGETEKGLANLNRAVTLAPAVPALRLNLARAYLKLDRRNEAREHLDTLLGQVPEDSPAHREASALRADL
ncbi:XrtA/PEP-CTERM system TPR-repeat protein PrsT [Pseudothauera rhizosphaerae]|uniref:XrtA/PEP-CTERM system TPR-repeat protein PrsT n=1 Tax=Pseudothauera rhizosphaerae TaxID=2565932 RepID=UPI001454DAC8|nr:XrtA/PEP-CTERM system TPR-repeat protein PrsT [Pseudothauera rhizosphaerae]